MTECMDPMPLSHGDDCLAECPPAAPVSNNNVCEAADVASECHPTLPVFNTDDECVAATEVGQCHPTLPVFDRNGSGICEAAQNMSQCHPTLPVFNADDECEAADVESECHATLPFFDPGDSTCKVAGDESQCPAARPMRDTSVDGNCRARMQSDCDGTTTPILGDAGACRVAVDAADCALANSARPIFVSAMSCQPAVQTDCDGTTTPILGDAGACRVAVDAADCALANPARPIFESAMSCQPAEQADCDGTITPILGDAGACRGIVVPAGTVAFTGEVDANHAQYVAVAGNLPLFDEGETSGTASSVTQGSVGDGETPDTTDDRVFLDISSASGGTRSADGLLIDAGNAGGGGGGHPRSNATSLDPTSTALAADRRRGTGLGAGTPSNPSWNYDTATFTKSDTVTVGVIVAVDEFGGFVVDWSSDENNYLGGGVWTRLYNDENSMLRTAVGAFVDGTNPTEDSEIVAVTADATATYRGHAYGRYSLNNGIAGDANPGFFAAKAVLNADFGTSSQDGTISGRIHNFLFSQDNEFEDTPESISALEAAIGGADRFAVTLLGEDNITGNSFGGAAAGSRIQLPDDGGMIDPVGQWGGRFYGTPNVVSRDRPQLVGGTFGAAGAITGGLGFSLIGSFGASYDTSVDLTGLMFAGNPNAAHAKYVLAAGNTLLFADGVAAAASSVTQGSISTANDRVYLAALDSNNLPMDANGVLIDVGGDGSNILMATSAGPDTPPIAPNPLDRRRGAGLGTTGSTTDPVWDYTTRSYTAGTVNTAGYIEVNLVDWANESDGSYLGGGVWVRAVDNMPENNEVGAFVDGEDTTSVGEIESANETATYRGHAYGRYSFGANGTPASGGEGIGDGTTDELNPGYFAAKATLTAIFVQDRAPTISGSITDFLFSTNNGFTDTSALETEIGGADGFAVHLGSTTVSRSSETNSFNGTATSSDIRLPGGVRLSPTGTWGGRFYGTATFPNGPQVVGGTFGVAAEETDGPSFSIIGAFGAKRQ